MSKVVANAGAAHPNGEPAVIKIGRKGLRRFALGDGEPVELDVIHVWNQWLEVDRAFRDEHDKIPRERWGEYSAAEVEFARQMLQAGEDQRFSETEAKEFIRLLGEEAEKLTAFFVPRSRGEPSSPQGSALQLIPD